jgi:hypothetical protein
MISVRTLALVVSTLTLGGTALQAQDLAQYRNFRLGSTVAAVEKASGAMPGEVKVVHQRPALIQELRWRPPQRYSDGMVPTEPVSETLFRFYNDQLFQIVVGYDRQRTEGLTDADLIDSLTGRYGVPVLKGASLRTSAPPSAMPADSDTVVARWSDAENSLTLVRGTYPTSLRLILGLKSVETLAQTASAEAIRQDKNEAPQREIDRLNKNAEDGRVAGEKARGVNKPLFKP